MGAEPTTAIDRRDAALACACGLAALAAYVRTLAPGLTSDVDSPMFQFIGRVLGVAHNPGYPLYALVTWPIAQIPVGSLAWRINLFSAAMGALAVGLTAIAARRLGCGRIVAAFAAFGLASGRIFWSQAIVAEVYTLHLVLVAALLQWALAWEASRRPRDFYAAVACLAIGLGHHTTIAAFAPALAAHALIVDRRFVLRLRTVATAAGICLLGLLPYLYVLIRSRDPQAYLDSRATTLGGLVQVVLGGQFRERLFTDPWTTVVTERIPALVTLVLRPDLTLVGLALALAGAVWLLRRRVAAAVLLITGAAIVLAFVAGYAVVDQPVFLLPVVLCLWLLAATGLERLLAALARALPSGRLGTVLPAVAGVLGLALPIGLAAHHGPRVDRSGDRAAARQIERLVAALPDRSAIAGGDFIAERMVQYELLGRDAAAGRDISLAPRDAASIAALAARGVHVVAFPSAITPLRLAGLDFAASPVPLADRTLDAVIGELPRGSIVALAIPSTHATGLRPASRKAWDVLGLPPAWGTGAGAEHVAVATVGAGVPARALSAPMLARLPLAAHEHPWTGRTDIEAAAGGGIAVIRAGGRDLLGAADGVAVAIWTPDGTLRRAFAVGPANGYQVPLEAGALTAYPLIGVAASGTVAPDGGPLDVTALASTGSVTASVPAGGVLALEIEDAAGAVEPYIVEQDGGARIDVRPPPDGRGPTRMTIAADGGRSAAIFVVFGAIPERLVAGLQGGAGPAQVRRVATTGLLRGPGRRSAVVRMTRDEQALLLGPGWSAVEADDAGPFRWITRHEARLVLPATSPSWHTLAVEAFRPPGDGAPGAGPPAAGQTEAGATGEGPTGDGAAAVRVRINGETLPAQPVQPGWHRYVWTLSPPLAAALGRAPAELSLIVDGPASPRRLAVSAIRFSDVP